MILKFLVKEMEVLKKDISQRKVYLEIQFKLFLKIMVNKVRIQIQS